MARDPHAAEVNATVIAGLDDIYLHVDSMHTRCISFLNGGGSEEVQTLLRCADDVLRSVWWLVCDSLTLLKDAGVLSTDRILYTKVAPEFLEGDYSYEDEERRAIGSLEGALGEVEQQIYGISQFSDHGGVSVRRTVETLLMLGYLSSIALERIEKISDGLRARQSPSPKPDPDLTEFICELGCMYLDDPYRNTEVEKAYIGVPTHARTREIGQIFHDLGGKGAMLRVHDAILGEHGRRAAGMLRNAWSGIGDWLAK